MSDTKDEKITVEGTKEQSSKIKVTGRYGYCLLEILVCGYNKDQKDINKMTSELQKQLADPKYVQKARIFYKLETDDKPLDDAKKWLLENSNAKYYIRTPDNYKVDKDFVKKVIGRINDYEAKLNALVSLGVALTKNKPKQHEGEEVIPFKENAKMKAGKKTELKEGETPESKLKIV